MSAPTPAIDRTAMRWRELLMEAARPVRDRPLLLSGGTDSAAILSAQLACGGRPPLYTFGLVGVQSADVETASLIAREFKLKHAVVLVERTIERFREDVEWIVKELRTVRKTAVQCAQPVLHLARRIKKDGHDVAVVGTGGVCEDNRTCQMTLYYEGEEAARKYRRTTIYSSQGPEMNGTRAMHRIAKAAGVELAEPLTAEKFAEYGLSLDLAEINRPRQKGIAMRAFPEFWKRGPNCWKRRNSPLQVNSGLREWHDEVLTAYRARYGEKLSILMLYNGVALFGKGWV